MLIRCSKIADSEQTPVGLAGVSRSMKTRTTILIGIILLAALSRLLWHPDNFTPMTAIALFAAAYLGNRIVAFLVPLAAMLLSDAAIEWLVRSQLAPSWLAQKQGFYEGMWLVYVTFALITAIGFVLRKNKSLPAIGGVTLAGSLVFFLVTNFLWWYGTTWYPHSLAGLVESYVAGLEFFKWTLLGDLFYATVLFGGFALAQKRYPALRPAAS